jgi:hypothetical protein
MRRRPLAAALSFIAVTVVIAGVARRSSPSSTLPARKTARVEAISQIAGAGIPASVQGIVISPSVLTAQEPPPKWVVVDRSESGSLDDPYKTWTSVDWVVRRPEEFDVVPPAIRELLRKQGCRIPQWRRSGRPHNVLWGEFDHQRQSDLVVLCVTSQSVVAYVFWAGEAARIEALAFGRRAGNDLTIATAQDVDSHAPPDARVTEDMPQRVEHDVIAVGCCGCCSTYYYRHRGRWFSALGSD